MLLFVMDAELETRKIAMEEFRVGALEEILDLFVDRRTVTKDFLERRPGNQISFRLREERTQSLVVRIKKSVEPGMKGSVVGIPFDQNEALEKPGRMGEMPLRWTRFGCGGKEHVLGRERMDELFRHGTIFEKVFNEFFFKEMWVRLFLVGVFREDGMSI